MHSSGQLDSAENLLSRRKLTEALRGFDLAESEGADSNRCAAGRWAIHMLRGDLSAAWRESDAIRDGGNAGANCLWNGESIYKKRVIVRCLHGFGDAVQFFRYAPRLNEVAKKVVWQVPPEMMKIAQHFSGVSDVISWEQERATFSDWDVQIECMELPNIFRTRIEDLPIATDYLQLPQELIAFVKEEMGGRDAPRIGLVWAAGEWDRSRSIRLDHLHSILQLSGCEFWNLQGGANRQCGEWLPKQLVLRTVKSCDNGIAELAAVISQLDLVITVDTLAAHLAGALGIPAWLILQYAADWRWMTGRVDSPWYPSLRLFRQPSPGNWMAVLKELEESLAEWLGAGIERLAA